MVETASLVVRVFLHRVSPEDEPLRDPHFAKSEASARTAIRRVADQLKAHGIVIVGKPEAKIENIVASGDLGGIISLEDVAARLTRTLYEPEQFPGLVYRMDEPKVVILIFASGKLVIAGTKREADLWLAAEKLKETLDKNGLISYHEPLSRGDPIAPIAAVSSSGRGRWKMSRSP
jgi:hypothetical protein